MQKKEYSLEWAGRTLTATFSDLANQANGSVLMKYGETVVLVTAVMSQKDREGGDFFPLTVDYEEKFYAAGLILGGQYIRREGRPSEEAILSGRIIDRTIRPLFDQRIRREVQIIVTVLSIDDSNSPDVLGVIGASLALGTSNIPWGGPIGVVRLGREKGESGLTVNPSYSKAENREFEILICGSTSSPQADGQPSINMIECEGHEVFEEEVAQAFEICLSEIQKIEAWQKSIIAEIGKEKERIEIAEMPTGALELFNEQFAQKINAASGPNYKQAINAALDEWLSAYGEKFPDAPTGPALQYFENFVDEFVHKEALTNNARVDGRAFDQIRPLFGQAGGISKIVHGTGIFYRGETHIISTLTLGGPRDAQTIEGVEVRGKRYFMHHYNFPPFSTGETGRVGATNRRSIGHGALAEKALRAILPLHADFPYTIRLVSEATASNGSTSMGSVCASSLALHDGGVPVKGHIAGIAMGLMSDENGGYKILTDIQGPEDHYGDMDFKVAGTRNGVAAIQLDIKTAGIKPKILLEALGEARKARFQILDVLEKAIATPRLEISPNAPKLIFIKIKTDQIGTLIGPGGKMINGIIAATGADIAVEDDGSVVVTGKNGSAEKAAEFIRELFREYKPGERFEGTVTRLMDFGAFVKIGPNAEGLVHISEMAPFRVEKVTDVVKEGDVVPVVVKEIDEKNRINLSIKEADPEFATKKGVKAASPGYNNSNERGHKPYHAGHGDRHSGHADRGPRRRPY